MLFSIYVKLLGEAVQKWAELLPNADDIQSYLMLSGNPRETVETISRYSGNSFGMHES